MMTSAPARGAAYALFSRLVASPNEAGEADWALPPVDLAEATAALAAELPYALDLEPLVLAARGLGDGGDARLAADYGSCFEVGSEGPPIPLREDLLESTPPGAREEIVRYYAFFGYRLGERAQWAPDRLTVELEFLHYLCHLESSAAGAGEARSYHLAQRDFLARHPGAWAPEVGRRVASLAGEPYYRVLFEVLAHFLERDHAWLEELLQEVA